MDSKPKTKYEPDRIPSSVFSTKPTTATQEWSVASNESLFSIHTGNHSFARDVVLALYKSGELPKLDEHDNNTNNNSNVNDVDIHEYKEGKSSDKIEMKTEVSVLVETEEEKDKRKPKPVSSGQTRHSPSRSDASCNSGQSFAFPVLAGMQAGRHSPISQKPASRKPETPRQSPKPTLELQPQTPKSGSGGGCFSCLKFFSQQR